MSCGRHIHRRHLPAFDSEDLFFYFSSSSPILFIFRKEIKYFDWTTVRYFRVSGGS